MRKLWPSRHGTLQGETFRISYKGVSAEVRGLSSLEIFNFVFAFH